MLYAPQKKMIGGSLSISTRARRVTRYQTGGKVARLIDKSRNLNEFFRTQEHRRPLRSLESLIICLRHAARSFTQSLPPLLPASIITSLPPNERFLANHDATGDETSETAAARGAHIRQSSRNTTAPPRALRQRIRSGGNIDCTRPHFLTCLLSAWPDGVTVVYAAETVGTRRR